MIQIKSFPRPLKNPPARDSEAVLRINASFSSKWFSFFFTSMLIISQSLYNNYYYYYSQFVPLWCLIGPNYLTYWLFIVICSAWSRDNHWFVRFVLGKIEKGDKNKEINKKTELKLFHLKEEGCKKYLDLKHWVPVILSGQNKVNFVELIHLFLLR